MYKVELKSSPAILGLDVPQVVSPAWAWPKEACQGTKSARQEHPQVRQPAVRFRIPLDLLKPRTVDSTLIPREDFP